MRSWIWATRWNERWMLTYERDGCGHDSQWWRNCLRTERRAEGANSHRSPPKILPRFRSVKCPQAYFDCSRLVRRWSLVFARYRYCNLITESRYRLARAESVCCEDQTKGSISHQKGRKRTSNRREPIDTPSTESGRSSESRNSFFIVYRFKAVVFSYNAAENQLSVP